MIIQTVEMYNDYYCCMTDIKSNQLLGWRVVSMVSVPTDKTTHEVYYKIIVVYEKEVEE